MSNALSTVLTFRDAIYRRRRRHGRRWRHCEGCMPIGLHLSRGLGGIAASNAPVAELCNATVKRIARLPRCPSNRFFVRVRPRCVALRCACEGSTRARARRTHERFHIVEHLALRSWPQQLLQAATQEAHEHRNLLIWLTCGTMLEDDA